MHPVGAFCIPQFLFAFEFECEWLNGNSVNTQLIQITVRPFTLNDINIYYFEMSSQIAIFNKKGVIAE